VEWVAQTLLTHPEIAVLLAVGLGAALGRLRYRSISLGAVTGTLIVGVLLGALVRIEQPDGSITSLTVEGPAKNLFFLLFLFALGIRLGPQFVAGLKGSGAPQALFAAILAVVGFTTVFIVAKVLDLNPGLAAGVAGGGLTQSAIVGVAQGSIAGLPQDAATLKEWSDLVPVAYAVTYLFGTIGTALYCANIAPRMLGITDLPKAAVALERRVGLAQTPPDVHSAYLDVTRRAYHLTDLPNGVSTAGDLEHHLDDACGQDHHVYVARIRSADGLQDATPGSTLTAGNTVVLTARRIDLFAPDLAHFAEEVNDYELLGFAIEDLWVVVAPPARRAGPSATCAPTRTCAGSTSGGCAAAATTCRSPTPSCCGPATRSGCRGRCRCWRGSSRGSGTPNGAASSPAWCCWGWGSPPEHSSASPPCTPAASRSACPPASEPCWLACSSAGSAPGGRCSPGSRPPPTGSSSRRG
jgi:AspT/YidE/YbjL antiporter-like protein